MTRRSIYLAGKIAKNDWRHQVVSGLRSAASDQAFSLFTGGTDVPPWSSHSMTVLQRTWSYTGPVPSSCDHGCGHSVEGVGHGFAGGCIEVGHDGDEQQRQFVIHQCLDAIRRCDIFFAWLDDPTAYGTLVEIGYARGYNKEIVVALPRAGWTCDRAEKYAHRDDLWFAYHAASRLIHASTPIEALELLAREERLRLAKTDSPIEARFWAAYIDMRHRVPILDGIVTQHTVGRYRLDFAVPQHKIGIELDGYEHHSSRSQFTRDRERQRKLENDGWRIVRFSGAEVNANPQKCVLEAAIFAGNIVNSRGAA